MNLYRYTDRDKVVLANHSKTCTQGLADECQDVYYQMLVEYGLPVDAKNFGGAPKLVEQRHEPVLPNQPVSYDEQRIPSFTTTQLSWDQPEEYGYYRYHVVERPQPFQHEYAELCRLRARKVHKYIRYDRFRTCLLQLMGMQGNVPYYVLDECHTIIFGHPSLVWEQVREVLKRNGWTAFYNRIPLILRELRYSKSTLNLTTVTNCILTDFQAMDTVFQTHKFGRQYFPNLRYVALRLLGKHGVDIGVEIPLLRTAKKLEPLGKLFDEIFIESRKHRSDD